MSLALTVSTEICLPTTTRRTPGLSAAALRSAELHESPSYVAFVTGPAVIWRVGSGVGVSAALGFQQLFRILRQQLPVFLAQRGQQRCLIIRLVINDIVARYVPLLVFEFQIVHRP